MSTIHEIGAAFSLPVEGGGVDVGGPNLVVDRVYGPYATIQAAVNAARPGQTVFVQPGTYAENVVVATDYISIVGGQKGRFGWPDIAPVTGVALTVTGQGFKAFNCRFVSNESDSVVQRGNGAVYERCVFDSGTGLAATEGLLRLQPSATVTQKTASECRFTSCLFRGASGVGVIFQSGEAPNTVGSTDCLFEDCLFVSSLDGTAGVDMVTQDNSTVNGVYSVKNLAVKECIFQDKNKATYLDFTTANGGAATDQSGTFARNGFASDTMTTTKIKAVGTAFTFMGNYDTVGVFDGSGLD